MALDQADATPFARAAHSAVHKIVTAMPARDAAAARDLADRVQLLDRPQEVPRSVPSVIQDAIVDRRVLRLTYLDREGAPTEREVEPVRFAYWYLLGWCRMRLAARADSVSEFGGRVRGPDLPQGQRSRAGNAAAPRLVGRGRGAWSEGVRRRGGWRWGG